MDGYAPPKKDSIHSMGEELRKKILAVVPSALPLEPQTLYSPNRTPVCFALPLLEPSVSGCKEILCITLREGTCISNVLLPLLDRLPAAFHRHVMWVLLLGSDALCYGDQLGVKTPYFSGRCSHS